MQKIEKKTKIFATIGPSSDNHDMMKALFEAGMNVIRLNFSHGDHEEQRNKIVIAQQIEKEERHYVDPFCCEDSDDSDFEYDCDEFDYDED